MKVLLLSGGAGTRLWPLSNSSRSKQFLKVLRNDKNELESMLQRVWRQLTTASLSNSTLIVTRESQVDMIQIQLGDQIPLIIEPQRRDTFPAIALAAAYLHSKLNVTITEVVCVLPVDLYVDVEFFYKLRDLESALVQTEAKIALLGSTPTYPSEKYGYIVPVKKEQVKTQKLTSVSQFIEKPNRELAETLIREEALWNCGVFAFRLELIISLLKEMGFPIDYDQLLLQFDQLPAKSFDYEVVEKVSQVVAIEYNGKWKDIGTWNTLTEEMDIHVLGNGGISEDSINTHVINELNIPVTVLGLSNSIVACSSDGILVSEKSVSPRVKEFVDQTNRRPMYEERRWGWYRVLDHVRLDAEKEALTKKIVVRTGKNLSYQFHHKRNEVWTILSGEGVFVCDDRYYMVRPGDVLKIPCGKKHAIKALTDLTFIEVQTGSELIEDDIVRIYMTWDEIKKNVESNSLDTDS